VPQSSLLLAIFSDAGEPFRYKFRNIGAVPLFDVQVELTQAEWEAWLAATGGEVDRWVRNAVRRSLEEGIVEVPLADACRYCGEPLSVFRTIRRMYCSQRCRVYWWRSRRRQLNARGTPAA
jgi:hypothetical protein